MNMREKFLGGVVLVSACVAWGCGEKATATSCGQGTIEVDGSCVPDGSVICGGGTVYNPDEGTCDSTGECDDGLVVDDNGICRDPSVAWQPDVEESEGSVEFALPDVDASVSLGGCITPYEDENGDEVADFDAFEFTIDAATLLDIRAEGVGGLSAAFVVTSVSEATQQGLSGFRRVGVDLTSSDADRQVWLPAPGRYRLEMTDSRSLFVAPAGGPNACYLTTVTHRSAPTPADFVEGVSAVYNRQPHFYRYRVTQEAAAMEFRMSHVGSSSPAFSAGLAVSSGAGLVKSVQGGGRVQLLSLASDDELLIVVDPEYSYGLDEVRLELSKLEPQVTLATNGTLQIADSDTVRPLIAFYAVAGQVVNYRLETNGQRYYAEVFAPTANVVIYSPLGGNIGDHIGTLCNGVQSTCAQPIEGYLQITDTGYHYLRLENRDIAGGGSYPIVFTHNHVTPTPLVMDATIDGDLIQYDSAFFTFNSSGAVWPRFVVEPTAGDLNSWDVEVALYSRDRAGRLNQLENLKRGDDDFGYLFFQQQEPQDILIRVGKDEGHSGNETFALSVAERDYLDLGLLSPDSPVEILDRQYDEESSYILMEVTPGNRLFFSAVSGAFSPRLDVFERNETGPRIDGISQVQALFRERVIEKNWMAFRVVNDNGFIGPYNIAASVIEPQLFANETPVAIPDSGEIESTITVASECPIRDITVDVDIVHSYAYEVGIHLVAPDGTSVELKRPRSGWHETAEIVGNYPDTMNPSGDLDDFYDIAGQGDWKLRVVDTDDAFTGSLRAWRLHLYCASVQ